MEARGVKGVLCPRGRVRQWKEGWRSPYRQQWIRKEGGEAKGYYGALLLALFVDASVERFEMRTVDNENLMLFRTLQKVYGSFSKVLVERW